MCVEEIDGTVGENSLIERLFADGDRLRYEQSVALGVYLVFRLLVEFGRVAQPYEDGIGLLHILSVAEKDAFDERGHDDGLACSCGCRIADYLRRMVSVVAVHGLRRALTQVVDGSLLECDV